MLFRSKIVAAKKLDPFAGMKNDEKENLVLSGLAKKEDVILSIYIVPFIDRAIRENPDFINLEEAQQLEILSKYASEKATAPQSQTIIRDNNGNPA